jgi:hypothetical protein
MSEEPKSIWKKSFRGTGGLLLAWLSLMVATLIIVFVVTLASEGRFTGDELKLWMAFSLLATAVIFLALFIRWLFCRRNLKRSLFGLACFATLIALLYAEEDWRGKHDWQKFKHEEEAKGEHFDFASMVPPPVPDDQNFALAPIWVESMKATLGPKNSRQWFGDRYAEDGRTNFADRLYMPLALNDDWPTNGWGNWQKAKLTDLKSWQDYYQKLAATTNLFPVAPQPQTPAQDVLLALSKYDSTLEELLNASQLPYSRFPLGYDINDPAEILLPHLAALKRSSQVLQLRAIAELQNGENEKAFKDVKLILRLTDSIHTEPFFICHLVRIAILQIALQPVYEGLAERKWSEAQLADLDSELAKLDFLADYKLAVRGERALVIGDIEFLRHPSRDPSFRHSHLYFLPPFLQRLSDLTGDDDGGTSQLNFQMLALGFGPSGWIDQNELRIAQFETKWYLPIVDENAQTISSAKMRAAADAFDQEMRHRTPENLLEATLMPALESGARKFAYAQSLVNLSRVAIALERYRLAHGEFPETLAALAPQFLEKIPHDIINGEPLHYRQTSDGRFVLYSVGWNEKDDGGVVVLDKKNGTVHQNEGDWVWRYPAK